MMMANRYDIQCGTSEETGESGTWIARRDGATWTRIATFIPGEYTEADEAILGNADALADALERLRALVLGECPSVLNEDSGGDARLAIRIEAALRAAGRLP